MKKPHISLAHWNNDRGLVASVIGDDGLSEVTLVERRSATPRDACLAAAGRLRELADAFERLADMDRPCCEKSHKAAMKKPRK